MIKEHIYTEEHAEAMEVIKEIKLEIDKCNTIEELNNLDEWIIKKIHRFGMDENGERKGGFWGIYPELQPYIRKVAIEFYNAKVTELNFINTEFFQRFVAGE